MQRVQLVELEDLPWFPAPIRDGGTDVLDFMFARLYMPEELLALAHAVRGSERYTWTATRGGPALCLIGYPKR